MFTTAGRDQLLDQMDSLFAGLLTAVTDLRAGTVTEATYTGYDAGARPAVTFGAQAATSPAGARQVANSGAITYPANSGSSQDILAMGLYTATSGGTLRFISFLGATAPFVAVAQDGSPDQLYAPAHGLVADNTVRVIAAAGAPLPTGLSENTTYYVMSTDLVTNAFRLSTAAGNSGPVSLTTWGACQVMPFTPVSVAGGATPEFAIGALVVRV
jgi:hypothetical protein